MLIGRGVRKVIRENEIMCDRCEKNCQHNGSARNQVLPVMIDATRDGVMMGWKYPGVISGVDLCAGCYGLYVDFVRCFWGVK